MATFEAAWDSSRERELAPGGDAAGDVCYWMSRDQRAADNWALLRAAALARDRGAKCRVVFALHPGFLGATERAYDFMLKGLVETERELLAAGYPFELLRLEDSGPGAGAAVAARAAAAGWSRVVCDFSPLREAKAWKADLVAALGDGVGVSVVDAHNVVPVWEASDKREVGARTIRKKINDRLPRYLVEFPALEAQGPAVASSVDWRAVVKEVRARVDRSVAPVDWLEPGAAAAAARLEAFCVGGALKRFAKDRNDPNVDAASHLSPYLHFGQLAPQRAALRVRAERGRRGESVASFLEEAVVRRELSDNFVHYEPNYDALDGAAAWARDSLELHASDAREFAYDRGVLERAETHEDIWNAAQRQMAATGKMHGFMRMYWCKKILEWSASPADALANAIYLNDRYSLDGRDPNGYVGIMWSICGTHDMGWKEREIFGKIRYMNYNGCKRKFKVADYAARWPGGPRRPRSTRRRRRARRRRRPRSRRGAAPLRPKKNHPRTPRVGPTTRGRSVASVRSRRP